VNVPNPNLLGQIARDAGYVTAAELEECLEVQSKSVAFAPIGLLLLEKGYLSLEELEELLRIQRARFESLSADPSQGGLFGQIAVRRGWITDAQLSECLRDQAASARSGSLPHCPAVPRHPPPAEQEGRAVSALSDVLRHEGGVAGNSVRLLEMRELRPEPRLRLSAACGPA
jgi:hypothetical protein